MNEFEYRDWAMIQQFINHGAIDNCNPAGFWDRITGILDGSSIDRDRFLTAWEKMAKNEKLLTVQDGWIPQLSLFMVELYRTYKDRRHGESDDCTCDWCVMVNKP
jgi:hypothetical protein